jgi:hypothetical protein
MSEVATPTKEDERKARAAQRKAAREAALPAPAVLGRLELYAYLGRSEPAGNQDLALGRIPPGFRLGRIRKWSRADIDAWLAADAPTAAEWEARKAAAVSATREVGNGV